LRKYFAICAHNILTVAKKKKNNGHRKEHIGHGHVENWPVALAWKKYWENTARVSHHRALLDDKSENKRAFDCSFSSKSGCARVRLFFFSLSLGRLIYCTRCAREREGLKFK
jgi:hypothetical protein